MQIRVLIYPKVLNAEMGNKKFYGDEVGVRKAW